jgi:hypothetical protein
MLPTTPQASFSRLKGTDPIRRAAVDYNVPLLTNLQAARLFVAALARYQPEDLTAAPGTSMSR